MLAGAEASVKRWGLCPMPVGAGKEAALAIDSNLRESARDPATCRVGPAGRALFQKLSDGRPGRARAGQGHLRPSQCRDPALGSRDAPDSDRRGTTRPRRFPRGAGEATALPEAGRGGPPLPELRDLQSLRTLHAAVPGTGRFPGAGNSGFQLRLTARAAASVFRNARGGPSAG